MFPRLNFVFVYIFPNKSPQILFLHFFNLIATVFFIAFYIYIYIINNSYTLIWLLHIFILKFFFFSKTLSAKYNIWKYIINLNQTKLLFRIGLNLLERLAQLYTKTQKWKIENEINTHAHTVHIAMLFERPTSTSTRDNFLYQLCVMVRVLGHPKNGPDIVSRAKVSLASKRWLQWARPV